MKVFEIENLYEDWYADESQGQFEKIQVGWRLLGARYKAKNISKGFSPKSTFEILDIGGGMGEVSEVLHREHSFPPTKLVEISRDAVSLARKKKGVKEAMEFNGYNIPLANRSIDFGFATHVLEHVPDPRRFLREVHRVCKIAFIEIPIDYSDSIPAKHLLSYGHVNVFTPSTARFLIESEGFNIQKEFPSCTQTRYDVASYNYFFNMRNSDTLVAKSKFAIKHLISRFKRALSGSFPSEYCFVVTPNDDFEITSLLKLQRQRYCVSGAPGTH